MISQAGMLCQASGRADAGRSANRRARLRQKLDRQLHRSVGVDGSYESVVCFMRFSAHLGHNGQRTTPGAASSVSQTVGINDAAWFEPQPERPTS